MGYRVVETGSAGGPAQSLPCERIETAMYDLVVIGGGSGGLTVALAAAKVGARLALVEKAPWKGQVARHGSCIPAEGLVQAAKLAHQVRSAGSFGISTGPIAVDFPAVLARVREVPAILASHPSADSLRAKGIDLYQGSAAFAAYDTIKLADGTSISGHRFVVATGSRPAVPAIPGLAEAGYLEDTKIGLLEKLPPSLIVIGAGPSGIEFAQCFARLGSRVTVLADSDRILPREDSDVSDCLSEVLKTEGLELHLGVELTQVEVNGGQKVCEYRENATGATGQAAASEIFVAAGRLAQVEGLNLESVSVHADPAHGIEVDDFLQTHSARVFAVGDVLMRHQYAHVARKEGMVAFQNAVLRRRRRMDYSTLPWATFSNPEVAAVGVSESQARSEHLDHRVYRVPFNEIDRARIDGRTSGFAKVVAAPGGKILGATVVGESASLILQEFVLAIEKGLGLGDLAAAPGVDPTYAAVARRLAGQHLDARLGRGFIQTALRVFYGFTPRIGSGNGATEVVTAQEPAQEAHAAPGHGHRPADEGLEGLKTQGRKN
jgi:pyruvate/2-oxoglutarate dehydrogenase complex dihydrolipoamide dehydrogenase (E3) component